MNDVPKINQVFSINKGVASFIDYDFKIISKEELDIHFYSTYGERYISPVVNNLISGDVITNDELQNIASLLKSFYSVKWDRLLEIYNLEYDPIHNYMDELTETIEDAEIESISADKNYLENFNSKSTNKSTRTDNLSEGMESSLTKNSDNTRTDNLSENVNSTDNITNSSNENNGIYGYNSSEASGDYDKSITGASEENLSNTKLNTGTQKNVNVETDVNESTITKTGTQINDITSLGENERTSESKAVQENDTKKSRNRKYTHVGNIGNLSTQKLILEEINLRNWNVIESILNDFKEFLTLPIYL